MSFRIENKTRPKGVARCTTPLALELLESRAMLAMDVIDNHLQQLAALDRSPTVESADTVQSTPRPTVHSTTTANSAPSVASPLRIATGTNVTTRTASVSVLGGDNGGEANLTYRWQTVSAPSGGSLTFARNNSNAAKSNTLTFNRAGAYTVRVEIVDRQGLSARSELRLNVVQQATDVVASTGNNQQVNSSSANRVTSNSYRMSAQVLDQFGTPLTRQPTIQWQTASRPIGATVTLQPSGNSVTATFNRSGNYTLAAIAGGKTVRIPISVGQQSNSLSFTTTSGSAVSPSQAISVSATNHRLNVRGIDQFGQVVSSVSDIRWQTMSAPSGGTASVSFASGVATFAFTRAGSYIVRATSGSITQNISFNVTQTLTRIVGQSATNQPIASNAKLPVTTTSSRVGALALDQFGQAMRTQPTFAWSQTVAPSGGTATISGAGTQRTVTFNRAGEYSIRAAVESRSVTMVFNVIPTLTSVRIAPGTTSLSANASQQFSASGLDQFQRPMSIPTGVAVTWTTTRGTISSTGRLTAPSTTGSATITAAVGNRSGSITINVVASTSSSSLQDPALASLVESFYADNIITRLEMIEILRSVGDDGTVNATELSDLRLLVSNYSPYTAPSFVKELAKDVVHSNPANLSFKGQTAGNLVAGSSATLLNNLVDKWFLGADEPAITGSGLSYRTATGSLFVGAPATDDALQGVLGDCYFIVSVASIAASNPNAIRNMFIDNGDDTFTVRFYSGNLGSFYNSSGLISAGFMSGTGTPDYVTVNRRLPTFSNGTLAYSGMGLNANSVSTPLWIALAEKAYAQWNETGNAGRDGTNRYAAIEGGWMSDVNAQVLGYNSTNYNFASTTKQSMISALNTNRAVTLGTTANPGHSLVGAHAYIVTEYNSSTDRFTLINPWGNSHPSPLTWTQLTANSTQFVVVDPAGSTAIPQANVRSGVVLSVNGENLIASWTPDTAVASTDYATTDDSFVIEFDEVSESDVAFTNFAQHDPSSEVASLQGEDAYLVESMQDDSNGQKASSLVMIENMIDMIMANCGVC